MLKEEFLEKLSRPIVELYMATEDKLLLSIAKHLRKGAKDKVEWELNKMAQLGALRQETIKTLSKTTKKASVLLTDILNKSAIEALRESGLKDTKVTENIVQLVSALQRQAQNHLNVVNTTMLSSTISSYQSTAEAIFTALEKTAQKNIILGEEATRVTLGAIGTNQAVKSAVKRLSDEGITAFVDSAGRKWAPEGYVRMDIVTTANNTAREAVIQKGKDYGLDVILVSSHAGARPQCAPYQGRCYSMSGRSGTIKDAYGKEYTFEPIQNTTYQKEPAGLFGINCHHTFRYIEEGLFVNREEPLNNEKEREANAREYAITQEMRAYERQIRKDTRTAQMLNTFEKGAGSEYTARANALKAEYKEFAKQTGNSPEWSRTKVF